MSNKHNILCIFFSFLIIFSSYGQGDYKAKWKNGFRFTSEDGNFKLKFGGRMMYDYNWYNLDSVMQKEFPDNIKSGAEFRRIRFYNSGNIYGNISYKLQFDVANGKLSVKDAYMKFGKISSLGMTFWVGRFTAPFMLEKLTSSKYITFIERSIPTGYFPKRSTGIMLEGIAPDKKLGYQIAYMHGETFESGDSLLKDNHSITARLSVTIIKNNKKHRYVHLGAAGSYRKEDSYSIKLRPEAHLAEKFLSTGKIKDVDNAEIFGVEAAVIFGPISFQGEFVGSNIKTKEKFYSFPGYYAYVSYFITGEFRNYKSRYEGFGRVEPKNNFSIRDKGIGALEVAVRYSSFDGNSEDIEAGMLTNITFGVNWHLNPATRIMYNYILSENSIYGKAKISLLRFQVDF